MTKDCCDVLNDTCSTSLGDKLRVELFIFNSALSKANEILKYLSAKSFLRDHMKDSNHDKQGSDSASVKITQNIQVFKDFTEKLVIDIWVVKSANNSLNDTAETYNKLTFVLIDLTST